MAQTVVKINLEKYCIDGEGILVIDTIEKAAPAKGGVRIHQNVTEGEIAALAAEMTKKCILAGLPFGGAKGGIRLPRLDQVERAMYAFGRELSKLEFLPYKWCAAPDVNTDSKAIDAFVAGCASVKGWRKSRLSATGKSSGIPHELGSTAYGAVLSLEEMIRDMGLCVSLSGAGVIVEGIGEVGGNAVKLLVEKGARILGVSDKTGSVYSAGGLDSKALCSFIDGKKAVRSFAPSFPEAQYSGNSADLLIKDADILLLAGPGRSITAENAEKLRVRIICEGANIAYEDNALRKIITTRGIVSIPGIIANSGGVISSYVEWLLESQDSINLPIEEKRLRVKNEIEQRIPRNIARLCEKMKLAPQKSSYDCALMLADEYLKSYSKSNRDLRNRTKSINSELEKKYSVFTV